MSVKPNKEKREYTSHDDLDWVNITVDIHDGWADDVSLIYPEESWKPDEDELTRVEIPEVRKKNRKKPAKSHAGERSAGARKDTASGGSSSRNGKAGSNSDRNASSGRRQNGKAGSGSNRNGKSGSPREIASDPTLVRKKEKNRIKPFRLFLILWLGILAILIAVGLGYFYDFAEDYERVYQASRPYHKMEEIMRTFRGGDTDTIYQMLDLTPDLTEFETEQNVKNYVSHMLEGVDYHYIPTANYLDDLPEYYVMSGDYILATVALRKNPNEYLEYGFPTWYISLFDFYTEAQHGCQISAPENCRIYINGQPVSSDYCYEKGAAPKDQKFFGEYAVLPVIWKYECTGFYEEPVVTAANNSGEPVPIKLNTDTGIYETGYGLPDAKTTEEMKAFAIKVAGLYANCISHDLAITDLEPYFVSGSQIFEMVKLGAENRFFSPHTTPVLSDETVKKFIPYSEDAFVCEVSINQNMNVYGRAEVVNTDLTFYFIKTAQGYQCCNIQY